MMAGPARGSSSLGDKYSEAEMVSPCGAIFRVFSVTTMASDQDGRSDSGFEASEPEVDPATTIDRDIIKFRARGCSISTVASDHDGRSDSSLEAFESEEPSDRLDRDTADALPSKGSVNHPHQCGPPCKYAWKASGCKDGANCTHCHLCQWYRSPMRTRKSSMVCTSYSKASKAQEKKRERARVRRLVSASEGDTSAIGSGYLSPGEEFWY